VHDAAAAAAAGAAAVVSRGVTFSLWHDVAGAAKAANVVVAALQSDSSSRTEVMLFQLEALLVIL
jgi:predicted nicotinamide N-methyase